VLNQLNSIINGGQSIIVFTIFSNPGIMLSISGSFFSSIKSFVSLDVLDSLSEVSFSISESCNGVISQFGVSSLFSNMVVDVGVQIKEDLIIIFY
jgi:hypothetical protein